MRLTAFHKLSTPYPCLQLNDREITKGHQENPKAHNPIMMIPKEKKDPAMNNESIVPSFFWRSEV